MNIFIHVCIGANRLQEPENVHENTNQGTAEPEDNSAEYFQERLRMLRARCGLDITESPQTSKTTPPVLGPSQHASSNIATSNERSGLGMYNKMGLNAGNTGSGSLGSSTSSLSSTSSAGMVRPG